MGWDVGDEWWGISVWTKNLATSGGYGVKDSGLGLDARYSKFLRGVIFFVWGWMFKTRLVFTKLGA
jgi:hypothetical protein